jgi:hypothetical protein
MANLTEKALSISFTLFLALTTPGCGASGNGEVVDGEEAVEKKQTVDSNVQNADKTADGSEKKGVECNEDTNDIGWCDDNTTAVFCVGAEKKWYRVDCAKIYDDGKDLVCGVRKGQTHVVCDEEEKFE